MSRKRRDDDLVFDPGELEMLGRMSDLDDRFFRRVRRDHDGSPVISISDLEMVLGGWQREQRHGGREWLSRRAGLKRQAGRAWRRFLPD